MNYYKLLLITFSTFVFSLGIITQSEAVTNKLLLKGVLPQGVVIKNNQITLKKGYQFEKISKSRVNVISRMRNGGLTGSFDCTCNGNDGGCDVITTPTSVSCAVSTCKSSCYMIITIPGNRAHGYLYRVK